MFQDIFSFTEKGKIFNDIILNIATLAKKKKITKLIGIEARGFIFAAAAAFKNKIGFVPIRKKNKLPAERYSVDFELEYGKATLEIHKDSVKSKEKVVIIDDLIATGGTAGAAAKLIEKSGGEVAGFIFVINLFDLGGKKLLEKKGYNCLSIMDFPGH